MRWAAGGMGAGWVQRGTKEGEEGQVGREGKNRELVARDARSLLGGLRAVGRVVGRAGKGWEELANGSGE